MAPTRRRSRKAPPQIEVPERVVIKTEVIDESYVGFYTPVSSVIKCENIDPGQYAVKVEPGFNSSHFITEIKTEDTETSPTNLKDKSPNRKTRKSSKRTLQERNNGCSDSSPAAKPKSNSDNRLDDKTTATATPPVRQTRSTRNRGVTPYQHFKPKHKANDKIQEKKKQTITNNNTQQTLAGCILHMKNILEVGKTLNTTNKSHQTATATRAVDSAPVAATAVASSPSATAEDKKHRQRVEALIPKNLRFPVGDYKCHSCGVSFRRLTDWDDHMVLFVKYKGCFPQDEAVTASTQKLKGGWSANQNKIFSCNFCSFQTKHKQDVFQHIVARHDPQCHKCALCTKTFNTVHYLKNHLSYKHDPTRAALQCSYCDYKTIDKYSLGTHERTKHTKEGYLQCDRCHVKTPTKYKMRLHFLRAHSSDVFKKKDIKCSKCNYMTGEPKRLREHFKRSHADEGTYSCAYCDYKGSKHYLEVHIFKLHMKDKIEKKFKCDICDKMFPSEAGLLTHNRIIHANTPETYTCKHCSLVFLTKHDCFIHTNLRHLAKPQFLCNECSFWAKSKDHLREHVFKKHRFTFYCAYCPFKTHAKLYIYVHINSKHNPNSKRFKCTHCKYVAKNKTLLNQHINVRHNPNPVLYTCFHCGHNNKIKHKLSQHMQLKHLNTSKKKKTDKNKPSSPASLTSSVSTLSPAPPTGK